MRKVRETITEDDALAIVHLARNLFGDDTRIDDLVDLVVEESPELRRRPVFVIGRPNDLVGYVCGQRQTRVLNGVPYVSDSTIEVRSLAVAAEYRGQRYGRALLKSALEWVRFHRYQQLIAQVPLGMESLFEAAGFTVSATGWSWLEASSYSTPSNRTANKSDGFDARLVSMEPEREQGYGAVAQANGEAALTVPFKAGHAREEILDEILMLPSPPEWVTRSLRRGALSDRTNWSEEASAHLVQAEGSFAARSRRMDTISGR